MRGQIRPREMNPLILGISAVAGAAIGLFLAFSVNSIPLLDRGYPVHAEFSDAAGLSTGNEVRVAGLKVGSVTGIELKGDRVLVSMKIDRDVDIPRDSHAAIILKTILGTKAVSIDALASGPSMKPGGTIPLRRTSVPFEIYQVTNASVDLLAEVDGEKLDQGLEALARVAHDPDGNVARALDGLGRLSPALEDSEKISALLRDSSSVLSALNSSSEDISRLIQGADDLAGALARRRSTVAALLRNTDLLAGSLGGLLMDNRAQIDQILRDLHSTLAIVDRNLVELEEALRLLGPSSESLGRVVYKGRWADICVVAIDQIGSGEPGGPNGPSDCVPSSSATSSGRGAAPL